MPPTATESFVSRIFGHPGSDAIGRTLDLIIPERLRQRHWDGYRRTMETGKSRYGEGDLLSVPAVRKDGTTVSIEFTIVPLKGESGQIIGMVAVMRDVTLRFEEIRTLKRRLADAAKSSSVPIPKFAPFCGTLVCELRNRDSSNLLI